MARVATAATRPTTFDQRVRIFEADGTLLDTIGEKDAPVELGFVPGYRRCRVVNRIYECRSGPWCTEFVATTYSVSSGFQPPVLRLRAKRG